VRAVARVEFSAIARRHRSNGEVDHGTMALAAAADDGEGRPTPLMGTAPAAGFCPSRTCALRTPETAEDCGRLRKSVERVPSTCNQTINERPRNSGNSGSGRWTAPMTNHARKATSLNSRNSWCARRAVAIRSFNTCCAWEVSIGRAGPAQIISAVGQRADKPLLGLADRVSANSRCHIARSVGSVHFLPGGLVRTSLRKVISATTRYADKSLSGLPDRVSAIRATALWSVVRPPPRYQGALPCPAQTSALAHSRFPQRWMRRQGRVGTDECAAGACADVVRRMARPIDPAR